MYELMHHNLGKIRYFAEEQLLNIFNASCESCQISMFNFITLFCTSHNKSPGMMGFSSKFNN